MQDSLDFSQSKKGNPGLSQTGFLWFSCKFEYLTSQSIPHAYLDASWAEPQMNSRQEATRQPQSRQYTLLFLSHYIVISLGALCRARYSVCKHYPTRAEAHQGWEQKENHIPVGFVMEQRVKVVVHSLFLPPSMRR